MFKFEKFREESVEMEEMSFMSEVKGQYVNLQHLVSGVVGEGQVNTKSVVVDNKAVYETVSTKIKQKLGLQVEMAKKPASRGVPTSAKKPARGLLSKHDNHSTINLFTNNKEQEDEKKEEEKKKEEEEKKKEEQKKEEEKVFHG